MTPDQTGPTRVLISFGAISGGFEFTMQLRRDIYRKFGVHPEGNPFFCYLDAESLRNHPSTTFKYQTSSDIYIVKNPDWASPFAQAMRECSTMIILLTKEWLTSKWCLQELDMAINEAKKRPAMKCVIVTWPDVDEVFQRGSWTTRVFETTVEAQRLNSQFESLRNIYKIRVAGASPFVGSISKEGRIIGNNIYNYSCSQAETSLILSQVI